MSREYSLQQLADLVGAQIQGDPDLLISGLNGIEHAQAGEITFVLEKKQLPLPAECQASACIAPLDAESADIPLLLTDQPS
ncbi:MAG: LpxD N-terminal domain-containing protein, partial [Desulfobulbus sp.]